MRKGFTLIEVTFYSAILSLLLGGSIASAYALIDANTHTEKQIDIAEEANFILKKLDWILVNVETVDEPAAGESGTHLVVKKRDLSATENPLILALDKNALFLKRGAAKETVLTTKRVGVDSFNVKHFKSDTSEYIEITFILSGTHFEFTKYIR